MNWARRKLKNSKYREYRPDHYCYNKELSDNNKHHTYYDSIIRDNVFFWMKVRGYGCRLMSSLICDDMSKYKEDANFHLSTLVNIIYILDIKWSDLMVDRTTYINPKLHTMEPPDIVKNNAVRREHCEEWKRKKEIPWYELEKQKWAD